MNYAKLLFPTGTPGTGGNPNEVNGLPKGSQPQNCEVLVTGHQVLIGAKNDRRDFYIVRTEDGKLIRLRICSAMAGYGYDEYVVIHDIEDDTPENFGHLDRWFSAFKPGLRKFK